MSKPATMMSLLDVCSGLDVLEQLRLCLVALGTAITRIFLFSLTDKAKQLSELARRSARLPSLLSSGVSALSNLDLRRIDSHAPPGQAYCTVGFLDDSHWQCEHLLDVAALTVLFRLPVRKDRGRSKGVFSSIAACPDSCS
jgi:hypothetical protein